MSDGLVAFTDLYVDRSGANFSLTFVTTRGIPSDRVAPATTAPFTIDFGLPTRLGILTGTNPAGAVPGSPFVTQPTVLVLDYLGNVVSDKIYTITATLVEDGRPSSKPLLGATVRLSCPLNNNVCMSCASNQCGRAVWPNTVSSGLRIDSVGTKYAIEFSADGLAPVRSFPTFSVAPGAAASLDVAEQPTGIYVGRLFKGQPVVVLRDRANNVVQDNGVTIVANLMVDGQCCFAPSFSAPTVQGYARFRDCAIETVPGSVRDADGSVRMLRPLVQLRFTTSLFQDFVDSHVFELAVDAVNMSVSIQPAQARPGRTLGVQPEVTLLDAYGRRSVMESACVYVHAYMHICMYACIHKHACMHTYITLHTPHGGGTVHGNNVCVDELHSASHPLAL
jgi:hypothetical protein